MAQRPRGDGHEDEGAGEDAVDSAAGDPRVLGTRTGGVVADTLDGLCRLCLQRVEQGLRDEARQRGAALRQLEERLRRDLERQVEAADGRVELLRTDELRLGRKQELIGEVVDGLVSRMAAFDEQLAGWASARERQAEDLERRLAQVEQAQGCVERLLRESRSSLRAEEALEALRRDLARQLSEEVSRLRGALSQLEGRLEGQLRELRSDCGEEMSRVKDICDHVARERDAYEFHLKNVLTGMKPLVDATAAAPAPPASISTRDWGSVTLGSSPSPRHDSVADFGAVRSRLGPTSPHVPPRHFMLPTLGQEL